MTPPPWSRGVGVQPHGRLLHVDVTDPASYDHVRDAVAELGLGLVRVERQRHRMTEIFTAPEAPPSAAGGASRV